MYRIEDALYKLQAGMPEVDDEGEFALQLGVKEGDGAGEEACIDMQLHAAAAARASFSCGATAWKAAPCSAMHCLTCRRRLRLSCGPSRSERSASSFEIGNVFGWLKKAVKMIGRALSMAAPTGLNLTRSPGRSGRGPWRV